MHIRNPRFRVEEIRKALFAVSDGVNELGAGKCDGTLWCTGLEKITAEPRSLYVSVSPAGGFSSLSVSV